MGEIIWKQQMAPKNDCGKGCYCYWCGWDALLLARQGAKIVVNDLGCSVTSDGTYLP